MPSRPLSNRNILLIAPSFYSYGDIIKDELELLGATVFLIDERPSNSTLFKTILRLGIPIFSKTIELYYDSISEKYKNIKITDFFFVNPEAVNCNCLSKLKKNFPNSNFTLYMWDSLKNKKNVISTFNYFDKLFSFDPDDVEKHKALHLQPLFYNKDIIPTKYSSKYHISFAGSIHSDRLNIVEKIKAIENIDCKFFLYSPSLILSILKLLRFKKLSSQSYRSISYKKIPFIDIKYDFENSKAILDIHHPNQVGLTMRTFEALGSNKKLITTNKNILNYDFYNPNNILVIDRNNIDKKLIIDFLETEYDINGQEKIKKHQIDNWLLEILN